MRAHASVNELILRVRAQFANPSPCRVADASALAMRAHAITAARSVRCRGARARILHMEAAR